MGEAIESVFRAIGRAILTVGGAMGDVLGGAWESLEGALGGPNGLLILFGIGLAALVGVLVLARRP
ncbi:MAG TPA: hypothetical protein VFK38_00215 [Candidatus Limnocylindrales bacterium]|nr:hypothetical protein [Candidatus Limnocylindrales bacterium]